MKQILLTIFPILILTSSCVREVTMDAMEEPTVVVECVLSNKPVQTLYLSYTKGASRDTTPDLLEASAVLTDMTLGNEIGCFERVADGSWQLLYAAIPKHNYRLDITIPGCVPIWAEQEMPEPPSIDANWNWWREMDQDGIKYRHVHGYVFTADTLNTPVWFYGLNSRNEAVETLYTDYPDIDGFNELSSIVYDAHDERSLWDCYFGTSSYPDLNGAVGHSQYLRFPKREAEKTEFLVSGDFLNNLADPTDFIHSDKSFSELHFFAATEDYDRYLLDCFKLEQISTSSNLSDMFLRDNVYSNIHEALGIFGAKVETTLLWDDDSYWGKGPFMLVDIAKKVSWEPYSYFDWDCHQQFSILAYEVKGGHPEEWKYGPKYDPSKPQTGQGVQCTLYSITSEEQLADHNLAQFGYVDFSSKTVLVVYYTELGFNLPFLIDYFKKEDTRRGICYQTVHISVAVEKGSIISGYVDPFTSSRIALIVDKTDESKYKEVSLKVEGDWIALDDYPTYLFDTVLPEMGVIYPKYTE